MLNRKELLADVGDHGERPEMDSAPNEEELRGSA
jgi:hypothetical protein